MILGLDTTTEFTHLALLAEDRAWTCRLAGGPGRSASLTLLAAVDELLAEAGAAREDLAGVCACVGPGGFTSLRIGVATAEGLALTGLPTWGFSAFALRAEALAAAGHRGHRWILLDGQRGEAFAQPWAEGPVAGAAKVPIAALAERVGEDAWWAPEAFAAKVEGLLTSPRLPLADEGAATRAGLVALCRRLVLGEPEAPLHPFYLRETDAELNFPHFSGHLDEAHRRGRAR